jgi:protein-tyrosine phosphatase
MVQEARRPEEDTADAMTQPRTSLTHPLLISRIDAPGGGVIGVTLCPGKTQGAALTGAWARDLAADIEAIRAWGAALVITLVTDDELRELGVLALGQRVRAAGMAWRHLPILDFAIPTKAWEDAWTTTGPEVHAALDAGGRVLVHCKGGLGRAGSIAARILIERGMAPDAAIAEVRRVRPGAIETGEQEGWLRAVAWGRRAGVSRSPGP